jgi:hypothetical protein
MSKANRDSHQELHEYDRSQQSVDDHVPQALGQVASENVEGWERSLTPPDSTLETNTNMIWYL